MSENIAPWLDGLGDGWNAVPTLENKPDANHASGKNSTQLPRQNDRRHAQSINGRVPNTGARDSTTSISGNTKGPLAPLTAEETNSVRRAFNASNTSLSLPSEDSVVQCGTVQIQQRSKSSSPKKDTGSLEWRKRLLHGKVGYGDQTDLFGPSGLENIFARSGNVDGESDKNRPLLGWRHNPKANAVDHMPSSPPLQPWNFPSSETQVERKTAQELQMKQTHTDRNSSSQGSPDESLRSNPFDLQSTDMFIANSPGNSAGGKVTSSGLENEMAEHKVEQTGYGQTELEQEDFSPVFVSKHTNAAGKVDYAALDSRLVKQLNDLKMDPATSEAADESSVVVGADTIGQNQQDSILPSDPSIDGPDFSVSENLTTGTPPIAGLNDYVQMGRGGYSTYGSFKERPLSPSPTRDEGSQLCSPADSAPATPSKCSTRERSLDPENANTPMPQTGPGTPKTRSSGSPLKLFGPHDTFTNNRLLRRMSQLNPGDKLTSQPTSIDAKRLSKTRRAGDIRITSTGSFGNGDLDKYPFQAEITVTSASDDDGNLDDEFENSTKPSRNSKPPSLGKIRNGPVGNDASTLKRKLSGRSRPSSRQSLQSGEAPVGKRNGRSHETDYGPSKRMPTSPFKDPMPKRRRTLDRSEFERVASFKTSKAVQAITSDMPYSRKRKDARQGEIQNDADPETLATRRILRPRNPTPTQTRQEHIIAELKEATEEFAANGLSDLTSMIEQIETTVATDDSQILQLQAEVVANEIAAFTLRVSRPSSEFVERKRSVTTQDFLNEAMMVMNLIRAKARPQSGLGSVEESETEGKQLTETFDKLSALQISRPPSREGRTSAWRTAVNPAVDSRIASHLRKFRDDDDDQQEEQDESAELSDSMHDHRENSEAEDYQTHAHGGRNVEHVSIHVDDTDRENFRPSSQRSQGYTLHSNPSETTGTSRTLCTTLSKRSDNVGTLAPDVVAHLIGEQVGTMTFDKDQQKWVRVKKSKKVERKVPAEFLEPPSHITSEDDPFREISDLPVDEQAELRRVSAVPQQEDPTFPEATSAESDGSNVGGEVYVTGTAALEEAPAQQAAQLPQPATQDGSQLHSMHSSTFPSRCTFLSSVQQEKVETRATSWNDDDMAKVMSLRRIPERPLAYAASKATIALQSQQELTSALQPAEMGNDATKVLEEADLTTDSGSPDVASECQPPYEFAAPRVRTMTSRPSAGPRSGMREPSLRRRTLTGRFRAAENEDQSELSLIATLPGDRFVSLSLSVSKPQQSRWDAVSHIKEVAPCSPCNLNSTFLLSDLPDFTICEDDETRPSEQKLAARLAGYAAEEAKDRYALAVRDLVKTLTDVQADELYWDDVTELDLRGKQLASLFGLDDFCTKVKAIDLSNNSIAHLHGAPITTQRLCARNNLMTNLTAFSHLPNLHLLDISANKFDSLDGMKDLIHLRELKANNNQISHFDGLYQLDGLLRLELRRNVINLVDLSGSSLIHLEHLDLSGNCIRSIRGLSQLESLKTLRLDDNDQLQELCLDRPLPRLEVLSVRNCSLHSLDVSGLPHMRTLNVDDNALCKIRGIETLRHLEVLSMRRQKLNADDHISLFDKDIAARHIYLSGNKLPSFHLPTSLLNVQHMELAATGLRELPVDFGLRMPNLRSLNLNFNGLTDLRPLLNIQKLASLSVCGNRLDRLRRSLATLARMRHLCSADLRDNPLTHGFYGTPLPATGHVTALCNLRSTSSSLDADDEDVAGVETNPYRSRPRDADQDVEHMNRLDEATRLRRRVYETLLVNSCPCLETVDGMKFDRTAAAEKDRAFERLIELGVIRKSTAAEE